MFGYSQLHRHLIHALQRKGLVHHDKSCHAACIDDGNNDILLYKLPYACSIIMQPVELHIQAIVCIPLAQHLVQLLVWLPAQLLGQSLPQLY